LDVAEATARIKAELSKAIVGQTSLIEHALVAILADGHVLLEGVPGVAKTLLVRSLARVLSLDFRRIQFTPDLMPSDVVGTNVFDAKTGEFVLRKGPVFTSILLADEINRTPPKTQSALLEAMEERKATIDGVPYPMPVPFIVFATQNPIEFEGTYPLPEAQLDRFLMKLLVPYPEEEEEVTILRRYAEGFRAHELDKAGMEPVLNADDLQRLKREVSQVRVDEDILHYINKIVRATRHSDLIAVGGSPRAGIAILLCAQAIAAMRGRDFITPDDVKEVALPVLRHRIILRPEAEVEGFTPDQVLRSQMETLSVPR
jgi:MoxR-like ATPase